MNQTEMGPQQNRGILHQHNKQTNTTNEHKWTELGPQQNRTGTTVNTTNEHNKSTELKQTEPGPQQNRRQNQ